MNIIKVKIGEELKTFLGNFSAAAKTDENNVYIQVTPLFKYDEEASTVEVVDMNNLPSDLQRLLEKQKNMMEEQDEDPNKELDPESEK